MFAAVTAFGLLLLETPRLELRAFTRDAVDDLVALDSDPHVMRFITGGRA